MPAREIVFTMQRKVIGFGWLLVALAAARFVFLRMVRNADLLSHCTFAASLPYRPDPLSLHTGEYAWLYRQELLFVYTTDDQARHESRQLHAFRLFLSTAHTSSVRMLEGPADPCCIFGIRMAASPVGGLAAVVGPAGVALVGTGEHESRLLRSPCSGLKDYVDGPPLWTPDGSAVVQPWRPPASCGRVSTPGDPTGQADLQAIRWDVHHGRTSCGVPVGGVTPDGDFYAFAMSGSERAVMDDLAGLCSSSPATVGLSLPMRPIGQPVQRPVSVYAVTLDGRTPARRIAGITLPPQTDCLVRSYSPGARRIAWLLLRSRPAILTQWLHRVLPLIALRRDTWIELEVSSVDGSDWRSYGSIPLPADNPMGATLAAGDIQWLPGGKAVSFVYKGDIWVLPVE